MLEHTDHQKFVARAQLESEQSILGITRAPNPKGGGRWWQKLAIKAAENPHLGWKASGSCSLPGRIAAESDRESRGRLTGCASGVSRA